MQKQIAKNKNSIKISNFEKKVYSVCKKIPLGKLSTYKKVATAIGNPKASRAVGNALNKNPLSPNVPCHRVIRSDGFVGDYAKGTRKKVALLRTEGIRIKNNKVVNLSNKKVFL